MPDNILGSGNNGVEIPEKFYQPETVEVEKDGKKESVPFDFDGLQIPEKLVVKNEDGSVNHEKTSKRILATTHKTIGSYTSLEKKLGNYEAPPEKEDGYKLDYTKMPENMRPAPESEKAMLKRFHGMGISNKHAQGVLDYYAEILNQGVDIQGKSVEEVEAELGKEWGDGFGGNIENARVAINTLLDEEYKGNIGKLGFDVKLTYKTLMKVLAKVGADLREDNPPAGGGDGDGADVDTLMKSEAYWNAKHPEHDAVTKKVKAYFDKKFAEKG